MKKGFTLIELLAIIIILAIVALVATPIILDTVEDSKRKAYNSSVRFIIEGTKQYYSEILMDDEIVINEDTNLFETIKPRMQGEMPSSGEIYLNKEGQVSVALVYNKTCYIKDFGAEDLIETKNINNCKPLYIDKTVNGAVPELDEGMIPVVYENGIVKKANVRDTWYNYSTKEWANAVLVTDATRNTYKNAAEGTTIQMKDILAFYVWIPRYRYQIFTDVKHITDRNNITSQSNYVDNAHLIDIVFENKNVSKSNGSNIGEWLTHPAFTFGTEELNGIWVGKFETTGSSTTPTVLPTDTRYNETKNIVSLRSQNVSTQFTTSRKLNYGTTKDAAMLKNSEWGAIAYLSTSNYGLGVTEVMINNSTRYNTGCAASVAATTGYGTYTTMTQTNHTEGPYNGCENEWYTTNGIKASTTGNIYGVYDMNGGAWEYVMGVIEDALNSGIPASGRHNLYNSGFTGKLTCPTCDSTTSGVDASITAITGVSFPESKYYELYSYGTSNWEYSRGYLGDATLELNNFAYWMDADNNNRRHSGFHEDCAHFVYSSNPWFIRGGNWHSGATAGVFAFHHYNGNAGGDISFRSVLR